MGFRSFSKIGKTVEKVSAFWINVNRQQKGICNSAKVGVFDRECLETRFLEQKEGFRATGFVDSIVGRNVLGRFKENSVQLKRFFGSSGNGAQLDRDFLAQLWIADKKLEKSREKRRRKVVKSKNYGEPVYDARPQGRWFSGSAVPEENPYEQGKPVLHQPPVSQSVTGFLEPSSPEEVQVAPLLARSNLLITRDIEWANLVLGFEQENRYAIVDVCYPQSPVGLIREQSNVIARQLLRLRRPFVAYITDAMGNELFRVRRPFWWITSSIYVEINGKEIGVVHRRWHLWRRVYDLYLG
ncbi:hypothetical protein Patl1_24261 [Pistacia atlantica]|uniref:Uncharacterized protein n=1 Tax=Pistacia atlantica TaxID=434234 RepID=A0ACC0ZTU7_9ROSI|nr:hypothetical protein Patl1_24261 [Pistacia atlantica]